MKYLKSWRVYESDYNYHVGNLNGSKLQPYYSDNIFVMSGRGTGHFGSGMYFSTYNHEDKAEYSKKYQSSFKLNPELIQVDGSVYRVDLDIYKNLFRVKSTVQAEFLFKTLKNINHLFYYYNSEREDGITIPVELSKRYLIAKNNCEELGIKIPPYREFINLLETACKDYIEGKYGKKSVNSASMSTRIMEYSGFNGVNVSGIKGYDNTTHGSVIYDVSKLSSIPIEVKDIEFLSDIKNNVIGGYKNIKANLLRNSTLFFDEIKTLSTKDQIIYIKRFSKYLPSFLLEKLPSKVKEAYVKSLPNKIKNNLMENDPNISDIELLIDNNYINLIIDKNVKIGDVTFLCFVLGVLWKFPDKYQKIIFDNINREMDEQEKYYYDDYKNNWLDYL